MKCMILSENDSGHKIHRGGTQGNPESKKRKYKRKPPDPGIHRCHESGNELSERFVQGPRFGLSSGSPETQLKKFINLGRNLNISNK